MRKYIVILSILAIISSLCICVYAEDITGLQEQSNDLAQQLNETNNQLRAVQEEISAGMQELQELDNKIAESENDLSVLNADIGELTKQITENEAKLDEIQKEYDEIQKLLDTRLIKMYETPKLQFIQVLLESKSVTDFLSTYYAMKELAEYDAELLQKVNDQRKEIETVKLILQEKKSQIVASKQTEQKKKQVLANARTKREYYLSQLSEEEKELQAKIDEYNFQVAEIEAEIKLLALNSISEDYIGGAMIWPVPGYNTITSQYGMRVHPITGAYKLHTGTDISAPIGASFVAAANGIVSKATFNPAYGNMVIIDHGGGVQTLYAHGSEIIAQVGQVVSTGTEILKVGSTGYSTGPHAHFEIRINGYTVDPMEYLLEFDENQKVEEEEK